MNDTTMSIIAIVLGAILMFIFPLIATADRSDDISQQILQTEITEFVDDVRSTGKVTEDKYEALVSSVNGSTGHVIDVQMEASILDESARKKKQQADSQKVGEGGFVKEFHSQIIDAMEKSATSTYTLKQGDIFTATATNKDRTIAQVLKGAFYRIAGNDTYAIAAKHTGIVNVNG